MGKTRVIALLWALALMAVACSDSGGSGSDTSSGGTEVTSAEGGATAGEEAERAAGDTILRLVDTSTLEAFPDPLGYDIQMEPARGNAEFLMRPTVEAPEPWLAETVEQLDPTTWRVTLHEGITFQNGKALDAEALKSWLDYYGEVEGEAENAALLGNVTGVKVSGPLSVDLTTAEPFPNMPYGLAHYVYPVFDAEAVRAVEGDFSQLVGKGIYTGPYELTAIEPGLMTYERNGDYWQGTPALAGITVKKVGDEQAGLAAIAAGEADMAAYPSLATGAAADGMDGVHFVTSGYDVSFVGLAIEPRIAPFDDVKVRQAVAAAIDTDAITEGVGFGLATPMHGWFNDDDPRNVEWSGYDAAKAEQLLDEAGWVRNGDGGPRTKDGKMLEARLYAYTDTIEALATAVSGYLEKVGFDAPVRRFETYADIQPVQSVDGGIYTVNTENYGLNGDPLTSLVLAMSPDYTTPGYDDVLALLAPAGSSSDKAVVDKALVDAQTLIRDQAYWIPVMSPGGRFLVSDAYQGYEPDPFYLWIDWTTAPSS